MKKGTREITSRLLWYSMPQRDEGFDQRDVCENGEKVDIIGRSEGKKETVIFLCTFKDGDRVIIHPGTVTLVELLRG